MGRIALELARRVPRKAKAQWRHWTLRQVQAEGYGDFVSFFKAMEERNPLVLKNGLIERGIVATNDPAMAQAVLTLIMVD
jgi:hypothetical protein